MTIPYDVFAQVDIRVGTIIAVEPFPQARKPAYKLTIDFGSEIGTKRSSAQLTANYALDGLVGRQVAAVVNFAPRQIGPFMSEVLVLGFPDATDTVVLTVPDKPVPNGGRLF
ncbi:MAG TPA: tRNA-binding protein [Stellaceae bacterium]|nr:tRNA-binding protein [Stellaceae bacterium]